MDIDINLNTEKIEDEEEQFKITKPAGEFQLYVNS